MDDEGIPDGYRFPKDDAWTQCTLRGLLDEDKRLWLHCYGCHRHRYVDTRAWVEKNAVDIDTPILLISRRVRCTRCNRLTVTLAAEPYSNLKDRPEHLPTTDTRCPVCGVDEVYESGPLRRPIDGQPAARFLPYTILSECECLKCGNWWTQPRGAYLVRRASVRTIPNGPCSPRARSPS
jgi:hypothetical protein